MVVVVGGGWRVVGGGSSWRFIDKCAVVPTSVL